MINNVFIYSLIITSCIGCTAGYLGSLMVTKRMALMSGALGHLTLPGIAFGFLYGIDISLCALVFLILGSIIIWALEQKTHLPTEAITAIVFSSSLALSFLILPEAKAQQALLGDISQLSPTLTLITAGLCLCIFLIVKKLYSGLVLMSISQDIAHTMNIPIKLYNLIYLICIALTVAMGVRIIGGLMTSALIAIPACTSKNLSNNIHHYAYLSLLLGGCSCALATLTHLLSHLPIGPMIVLVNSFFFLLSLLTRPLKAQ